MDDEERQSLLPSFLPMSSSSPLIRAFVHDAAACYVFLSMLDLNSLASLQGVSRTLESWVLRPLHTPSTELWLWEHVACRMSLHARVSQVYVSSVQLSLEASQDVDTLACIGRLQNLSQLSLTIHTAQGVPSDLPQMLQRTAARLKDLRINVTTNKSAEESLAVVQQLVDLVCTHSTGLRVLHFFDYAYYSSLRIDQVDLRLLPTLPHLHTFQMASYQDPFSCASEMQMSYLMSCPQLTRVDYYVRPPSAASLAAYMDYRAARSWPALETFDIRGEVSPDLLAQLSRLSNLRRFYHSKLSSTITLAHVLDFLASVPMLVGLKLSASSSSILFSNPSHVVAITAASCCQLLKDLRLQQFNLTGDNLARLCQSLPCLDALTLKDCHIDTFASFQAPNTLTQLFYMLSFARSRRVQDP
jgi:hypothetical protein